MSADPTNYRERLSTLRVAWEAQALDAESFVRGALEAVAESTGADRVVLFLGHPSGAAAPWIGLAGGEPADAHALEEVSRSLVERALASGAPASWDVTAGPEPSRSAAQLRVVAAHVFPIGTPCCAALYLDHRKLSRRLGLGYDVVSDAVSTLAALLQPPRAPSPERVRVRAPPASIEELVALPGVRVLQRDVSVALGADAPVLIRGETGTGKTFIARALAERLGRSPVVRAMLGTSDDPNTLVSELYGHERGAFSGAVTRRAGLVEQADGGVLILDEVLNMPLSVQQLLLDFVQFGTYRPLGHTGAAPRRADVRIIGVTNGNLDAAVRDGRFRRDLYFRLAGASLHLPPLRDRRGDIPGLSETLLRRLDGAGWRLSLPARRSLLDPSLPWEGNVRELESVLRRAIERACIEPGPAPLELLPRHLELDPRPRPRVSGEAPAGVSLAARWALLQSRRSELEHDEDALIAQAMGAHDQVLAHAAVALGVPRTTLASRLGATRKPRA